MTSDPEVKAPNLPELGALEQMARELFGGLQSPELALPAAASAAPAAAAPSPLAPAETPAIDRAMDELARALRTPQMPTSPQAPGMTAAGSTELFNALKSLETQSPEALSSRAADLVQSAAGFAQSGHATDPAAMQMAGGKAAGGLKPPRDALLPFPGISLFEPVPSLAREPASQGGFGEHLFTDESVAESAFYFLEPSPSAVPAPVMPVPVGEPVRTQPSGNGSQEMFDVASIRRDFPILNEPVHGRRLIWLDNGATTQKPNAVIERLANFYRRENSNIHRAAHTLASRSTDAYEGARESVRRFLNAPSSSEIVFTRGATEAINLVAYSWGEKNLRPGDEIVLSWLEHHANIVPWTLVAAKTGARIRVVPVDDHGNLHIEEVQRLLGPRTRFVSVTQVSNAIGTVTPVREIVAAAHRYDAKVLIDGAQAVSHMPVDVQSLDCDFYVFSGHKIFAPTGIGALFGKADVLRDMPAWQGGGNMISDVTFERVLFQPPPGRFEAGTGSIGDAVALGTALDYVTGLGRDRIAAHEAALMKYLLAGLRTIPRLRIIGTPEEQAGVASFVIDGIPTEELGKSLDAYGIAVRAGHHCAQPILRRFGLEATVRPSLALYNSFDDLDVLLDALRDITRGYKLAPVA